MTLPILLLCRLLVLDMDDVTAAGNSVLRRLAAEFVPALPFDVLPHRLELEVAG